MKRTFIFSFSFFLGCSGLPQKPGGIYPESSHKVSNSNDGTVATAHPLATKAGVEMLAAGGNAVDAAVAAAFALAVVEPSMSGIGGRTQILIGKPDGEVIGIDGTTQAPSTYDFENAPKKRYGYPSIGVPGVVRGHTKALSEHGSLSLKQVMTPAIRLANNGHELIRGEAMRQQFVHEQLKEFAGSRHYFLNEDGSSRNAGDWVVQKDLGRVLQAIADEGAEVFYSGWIAEKIIEDNQANGGVLTLESLKNYKAEDSHIVTGSYRGYGLKGLWMPAYGAITIEALQVLETISDDYTDNQKWGESVYHAIKAAYLDRKKQHTLEDADRLTSKQWAQKRASEIHNDTAVKLNWKNLPESWTVPMGHTTHLTVVDRNGMVVALTQTVGTTMGSKVATPGLGFIYAQTLGGYLGEVKAGYRAASHISPILVTKDNKPFIALGAAGGSRIPSSIVAVISRIIDQGNTLEKAIALPRVQPIENGVAIEFTSNGGWSGADSAYFAQLGHEVSVQRRPGSFGRVHAVIKNETNGSWTGVADPDWEGSAASPNK